MTRTNREMGLNDILILGNSIEKLSKSLSPWSSRSKISTKRALNYVLYGNRMCMIGYHSRLR
ncbi:hypothetical protein E1A91_D10G268600v1 [Gossypium mustelinum]|uniref:Uncharacterized protein n=1 Tax=Gossypium mustelinum TaxID=34275 RepID=A0A5D2TBM5_GOSMU|nr:hypothetical protein E1A91_D10G268600v1 [Gossypium mustelinum]